MTESLDNKLSEDKIQKTDLSIKEHRYRSIYR